MAEFSEVIKQFKRGCGLKGGCPFFPTCNIGHCRKIAFEHPDEFERRVMEWAEAHPEPKFPRWSDYLNEMGYGLYYRIPADIAEKLAIKPKEG
jgi:hypothetical protein